MERIELDPEKLPVLTKAQLVKIFANSPKRVDRMLAATRSGDPWLEFFSNKEGLPGKTTAVTTRSAQLALNRILAGEEPPLMPSERKGRMPPLRHARSGNEEERLAEQAFKFLRILPQGVKKLDLDRRLGLVLAHFEDGSTSVIRKTKPQPGRRSEFSAVTFQAQQGTGNLKTEAFASPHEGDPDPPTPDHDDLEPDFKTPLQIPRDSEELTR